MKRFTEFFYNTSKSIRHSQLKKYISYLYYKDIILTLMLPPPGMCLAFSFEPTFGFALSLKSSFTVSIFLSPPPGLYVAFSNDPTFGFAFH